MALPHLLLCATAASTGSGGDLQGCLLLPEFLGEALQEGALGYSVPAQPRACCLEAKVPDALQASFLKPML